MSILSGFKKVKNYILTSSGYQLLSRWTSSQTVEFDDGKTAEEKVGEINGIAKTFVDMKKITDNSIVPSATAVMEGLENSSSLIEMTQEQYDALSDEEKNDNNMRAITDAEPDSVDAKNVTFDNTGTGLEATNTQTAITEINGKLDDFQSNVEKTNIHCSSTDYKDYIIPDVGVNAVIICNSSWGGVSGTTFVLGGYALYYGLLQTHSEYTIPAPSTNAKATATVKLSAANKLTVKCNATNTFCDIAVITGGYTST